MMAVVQLGSIVQDIRGSVGEETYSRGQGGIIVRKRTGPGGVPNANQIAITDTMTDLSAAWSDTLTQQDRETWRTYAKQFPRANRWGKKNLRNGYTRFIATNFNRYVQTQTIATATAPVSPPLNLPAMILTATADPDRFSFPAPDINESDPTHVLWIFTYIGVQQNAGVNFYKHPFRLLDFSTITLEAWRAAPLIVESDPPAYTAGKKIWTRTRIQCSDSFAISPPAYASAIFDA